MTAPPGTGTYNTTLMALKVIIIDHNPDRTAVLRQAMLDLGHNVVAQLGANEDILTSVHKNQPDVILIDMALPDRDTLEAMRLISDEIPRPIVMFSEQSDSQTINEAIASGVSAYIVDGLDPRRLRPIMDVAIAQFKEHQALKTELQTTRNQLAERKDIERAKGILMRAKNLDEPSAYTALRKMAMDRNARLIEIAKMVISAEELLR
ncbi:MAG TPA: ANTAR domain-containing protein [Halothiobacillus sp.]|nr:ANTAR domain-containing protein [Halothiobacillus sp.]